MNIDKLEGRWSEVRGKVRERWTKFTDEDVRSIQGKSAALLGKIKERYGYATDKAQAEMDLFLKECNSDSCSSPKESAGKDRAKEGVVIDSSL